MKKKIVNVVLFLAVLAAALGMTFYVGNNAMSVLLYNFVFLGIIAVVYVVGLFGGMFRMNRLAQSLGDAAQGMERISAAGKSNADVAAANRQVVEEFDQKLQEFAQYQKLSCKTMEQVRRLLTDISAAGSSDRVQLTAGRNLQKESLEKIQETMQTQSEMQQELLEEISKNIRELSKGVQKGKFGLFR